MQPARILYILLLFCGTLLPSLSAQNNNCGPEPEVDTTGFSGTAFFNFGSSARSNSQQYRSSFAVGQTFVGYLDGLMYNSTVGFYSRYLLPPFALKVFATQGDLLDRIQISWEIDALGPSSNEGFNIYRDGIFLASVGANIRNYNDFNVIPGIPYTYTIRGLNVFGEGVPSSALGFQVPNGVVTGWVQTLNGSAVPDALITLMPMQGFSAKFGPQDGASAQIGPGTAPFMPGSGEDWTITFWMKTNSANANAGLLKLTPFPLYFRAISSAGGNEGVELATTATGAPFLSANFPDSTKNGWQHVAVSYDGSSLQGRLFINGVLSALSPMVEVPSADTLQFGVETGTGGWSGFLDEFRIYHKVLNELDFPEIMEGTASSLTPDISHYWKMDEEKGEKSFDIFNRHQLYFCGAVFDPERPPVRTSGKTNEQGYYRIESASYGTGTTFLAEPMKNFNLHRALQFKRAEQDVAVLPDFPVNGKATLETWVYSAGPDGDQCLLSKKWPGNDFRLLLKANGLDNDVVFYLNGQEKIFGALGMGYQHLAFTIDSSGNNRTVTAYKNGAPLGTAHVFNGVTGNWVDSTQQWVLGARPSGAAYTDHYGGLIDEVALYDTTLSAAKIALHAQERRDIQESGLQVYFALDEGNGNRLNNSGSFLLDPGMTFGTTWTAFAAIQNSTPHEFTPATRQVTLNPSVTSVDQVDFTDRSTIGVSGFVRYKNTDCFAPDVEILVNGESFIPRILTDSTGKFVVDFDPGTTAVLTPVFEDHDFTPAQWTVTNVVNPIAGILFSDITTRKITGKVAGGLCEKSVIKAPPGTGQGTVCVVTVRSTDGCFERNIILDNQEGEFEFLNLPSRKAFTVAVSEHSDPDVKAFFQVLGGITVNLTREDTIVDFIYIAMPEVEIASGLEPFSPSCDLIVLDQFEFKEVVVKLKEQYVPIVDGMGQIIDDGVCYIDTASFSFFNGFADEIKDTTMSGGQLVYKFRVATPNPTPPFLKTFQAVATTLDGNNTQLTTQGLVTGIRAKANTFVTTLPEIPTMVLRDPPGDGSYAYIEEEETFCRTVSFSAEYTVGGGGGIAFDNGPDVTITFGLGAPNIETETMFGGGVESSVIFKRVTQNSMAVCTKLKERLATSEEDLIVGGDRGADVYVGGGINIEFGFADVVTFDSTTCSGMDSVVLNVQPEGFGTTFMYSEFNIRNNVLRYLQLLANQATDTTELNNYLESLDRWNAILEDNVKQKAAARFLRNLSFDAGIVYEYSETSDTTIGYAVSEEINNANEVKVVFGGEIAGIGVNANLKVLFGSVNGDSEETSTGKSITTGYVLKDNDPGDQFTVDVGLDSVYNTPVFDLVSGQSSCPWEPGTANREGPFINPITGPTQVDIPANEPAVYQFTLGNLSASNEDWTYGFTSIAANNPNGAVIKLNGQPLNYTQKYIIPYGTSQVVTLTVERGPIEYEYDSLLVALYSECEYERNLALSIPLASDPNFFSSVYLNVRFIRPCSEVKINFPEQDFVVYPFDPIQTGTERRITVSGYDTTVTDFQLVRVQYRRSNGDGAWINIPGISDRYNPNWSGYDALPNPKPPVLQPSFTQFFWETVGLSDGPYEIRALATCTGDAVDMPGFSEVIKGRIDREPPSLVGTPQPSDGVYHVGDEVSFTFNKHINCNMLIPADLTQPNNVGLFDATTGQLIDIDVTCFENKIILDPNFQNEFFENKILRAELRNIKDLTGNESTYLKWEFYVDRNELAWLTDSLGITKFEDQTKTVTANIHNRGGYPVPFSIQDVPSWVHVVPNQGTLAPNEIRPISFTADSTLAMGHWRDSIVLHTETGQNPFFMGGDEGLPVGIRVVCRPPTWNLNAGLFENSHNFVLQFNIQGTLSADVEDMVVAFIGDTLVGRANIQYVPSVNKYLAYLTVYGNPYHILQPIRLEIWDASACLQYTVEEDFFVFQPDVVVGNPLNPQVLHTNSFVVRDVPLGYGWNWLSFNLAFADPALDVALASLNHPQNDLMKSQNAFATYFTGGGWLGSLTALNNTGMYIYRADQPDTLRMLGNVLDPATTPIPVVTGWNWIGYVPNYALPINDALSSLSAQTGDLIKSQTAFAQFINPTFGWIGNLLYLQQPNGYQIKLAAPGTLVYPPAPSNRPMAGLHALRPNAVSDRGSSYWSVDPTQYEHGMTLIGMLQGNGENTTGAGMELGAFAGEQVRGSAPAIYIEPLDAYLFFMTVYANSSGEPIQYKLFDSESGNVSMLNETMFFTPELHQGSIENPVPFTGLNSSAPETAVYNLSLEVQPNPFTTETMLRFHLPKAEEITLTISNAAGQTVTSLNSAGHAGFNTAVWRGENNQGTRLASGVYFVRLQTQSGSVVQKVVLQ